MEAGEKVVFCLGQTVFFLCVGYRFNHKRHIAGEISHCLQALKILFSVLGGEAVAEFDIGFGTEDPVALREDQVKVRSPAVHNGGAVRDH